MSATPTGRARARTIKGPLLRARALVVAVAISTLALASCGGADGSSDAKRVSVADPPARAWGDTRMPYREGSGRFCEVAAEGTSIRPDVVNRLVFLQAPMRRV